MVGICAKGTAALAAVDFFPAAIIGIAEFVLLPLQPDLGLW